MGPLLAAAVRESRQVPGPAGLLLRRANSVGIAWCPDSDSFIDGIGAFDIWTLSWPEITQRLVWAWQSTVQHTLSHRPTFEGLIDCDPHLTALLVKSFPPESRALIRITLNGTFFTNDALKHAGLADSPGREFCGGRDSIEHRLLFCPHFCEQRAQCALQSDDLRSLPPAQLLHGWARTSPALADVRQALAEIPPIFDDFHPVPCLDEYHLFVDGSSLRPEAAQLRLAAWAVNCALPGIGMGSLPLSDGLVPGLLQSAYRAELCATISGLLYCVRVRRPTTIWSDCLGVVLRIWSFLCGSWFPSPRSKHFDLWSFLCPHQEFLASYARICKVDSHLEPTAERTFGDEWCAAMNNQVDEAASRAQLSRPSTFWSSWQSLCRHWDSEWVVAREVIALHLRIAVHATRTARPVREPTLQTLDVPANAHFLGDGPTQQGNILFRKYGNGYLDKLSEFATLLRCGASPVRWISSLQLYIGFSLRFGLPLTFHNGVWLDLSRTRNGMLVHVGVAKRVRQFMQHLREYARTGQGHWRPVEGRPSSAALKVKLSCVAVHLRDDLFSEIETYLFQHLPSGAVSGTSRGWRSLPLPGP